MQNVWITSDLHFGHKGICEFTTSNGKPVRPWDNYEEMDNELVKRFNEKVLPQDKCYILGDVTINRRGLATIARLNCKNLVLIKGNHDIFRLNEYTPYFRDIRAYMNLNGVLLSHIPVHPDEFHRWKGQIHGHLHTNRVMKDDKIDPRYENVCVEQTDFYPVLLNDVLARFESSC